MAVGSIANGFIFCPGPPRLLPAGAIGLLLL
jgi:hypothetical protein